MHALWHCSAVHTPFLTVLECVRCLFGANFWGFKRIAVDVDNQYITISASWELTTPVPWDAICECIPTFAPSFTRVALPIVSLQACL
jgi:hypothetical protein